MSTGSKIMNLTEARAWADLQGIPNGVPLSRILDQCEHPDGGLGWVKRDGSAVAALQMAHPVVCTQEKRRILPVYSPPK